MLSGGQDSSAMTTRALELGLTVDYIVFCDTTLEHKEMYEYIDKLDAMYQRLYGIKITRIYPRKPYMEWVLGEVTSGEMEGQVRGVPLVSTPCYWRREAKEYSFNDWLKSEGIAEYTKYVGYVLHEYDRWKDISKHNAVAPLVDWKWNEPEVQAYLKENMIENKLYQDFSRTGCGVCQKQPIEAKYTLWKKYPDVWAEMVEIERLVTEKRKERGEVNRPAFHDLYYTHELEKLFIKKDKQATFEFDFEEVQDCFCKI